MICDPASAISIKMVEHMRRLEVRWDVPEKSKYNIPKTSVVYTTTKIQGNKRPLFRKTIQKHEKSHAWDEMKKSDPISGGIS